MLLFIILFALLLGGWDKAQAALSCGNAVEWNDAAPTITTQTISYTTPALSNMRLFVFASYRRGGGSGAITITHAGNSLTDATTQNYLDPMGGAFMYIDNPTSGTNNVVVTYATTGLARGGVVFVCSDINLAAGFRSTNQATGNNTAPTATVSSVQTGDLIVDCFAAEVGGANGTEGAGQTAFDVNNNAEMNFGCSTKPGASGSPMAWSITATQQWVEHLVVLQPSVAPALRRAASPMEF